MAEISKAPSTSKPDSDFDPETMRKTKPGLKRFTLTLTVLLSFLLGLPFLLKSIEIYRSPLPFREIDDLSSAIDSNFLISPCQFQAVFVNFGSTLFTANQLSLLIESHMRKLTVKDSPSCGSCNPNSTVSVILDSGSDCVYNKNDVHWKCGSLNELKIDENLRKYNDELFDEDLHALLDDNSGNNTGGKFYTIMVVRTEEEAEVKAVVGKYRHAWVVGMVLEEEAVKKVAEIFVKVFVNGGKKEGSISGEFMPVGADGRIVFSFNLLNADPRSWIYDWDFQDGDDDLLSPIIEALKPLADVRVESQVLYHTPKSSFSYWDEQLGSYIFSTKDLPFFMWGSVVVWNPPDCLRDSNMVPHVRHKISPEDLRNFFEVFIGQLRQLFGLKSNGLFGDASATLQLLASERGFTEWELDVLSRQHTCFNLLQCGTTLGSLSRLVQSLPRMIIKDEIGKQVKYYSLEAAKLTLSNVSHGVYDASVVSSRQARSFAEDAFYHPSMMSPFFLPVSLHVLLAVLREWKRYKQESKKYDAWKAKLK